MLSKAPVISILDRLFKCDEKSRKYCYIFLAASLTYLIYVGFHMCRVPIGIIEEDDAFLNCPDGDEDDILCTSWIDQMNNQTKSNARKKIGNMKTIWGFAYAFFMFLSGYIGDHMELRHFLAGSTILYAITVYLFGAGQSWGIRNIWYYYVIMGLQGCMSSTGWPGVVAGFGAWVGPSSRGLVMGFWQSNAFVGNIIGRQLAGDFLEYGWGNSFILLSLILGIIGIITYLLLVPLPSDVGITELYPNKITDDEEEIKDEKEEEADTSEPVGFLQAILIPGVLEFSFCLFCSKFVIYTFLFWLPNYISEMSGVNASDSGFMANFFEYGGIIGGIVSGLLMDLGLGGGLVCASCLVLAIPTMFCYQALASDWCPLSVGLTGDLMHNSCFGWHAFVLISVGLLVSGPYALITSAISTELGTHKKLKGSKALATVSAIINGTGSIGGAIGPFTAGQLPAKFLFPMVMVSDGVALVFLARLVIQDIRRLCTAFKK